MSGEQQYFSEVARPAQSHVWSKFGAESPHQVLFGPDICYIFERRSWYMLSFDFRELGCLFTLRQILFFFP